MTDAGPTIAQILGRNISAARGRAQLSQKAVATRMKALGFDWHQQTAGAIEKGKRRVTAEEILGLSLALEVSIAELMAPADKEQIVVLPSGQSVSVAAIQMSAHGINESDVRWDGDVPVFSRRGGHPPSWLAETSYVQAVQNARRRRAWELLPDEQQAEKLIESRAVLAANPFTPTEETELQPVVAAIVTSELGVLVGRRNDGKPPWTFIAGEQEPGERNDDTAIREVKEETGLRVVTGDVIGERVHPKTGRTMIYLAARPTHGTEIFVGDEDELAEVRWVGLAEADELLPGMFEPVHEYLAREIGA